jgi:hypothetical protein
LCTENHSFDHVTGSAKTDFEKLDRHLSNSAEKKKKKIDNFVHEETDGRVKVTKVKFMEHGKNAAYYVSTY